MKTKHKAKAQPAVRQTFRARAKSRSAKTTVLAAAAEEHRKMLKARRQPLTAQERVQAALADANGGGAARYDSRQRFDSGIRYDVEDPAPIVPGKAKPNLGLSKRTDANVVGFGHSHDEALDGNPYFPAPQPTAAVFDAKLGELEAILSALDNHRIAGKALTDQRDIIRGEFELLFTQRAAYVELLSEGDAAVIMSAGMPVKNAPTPIGILPPPLGLRVDRTQIDGELVIRWDSVGSAKSYLLEVAEVVNNVAVGWRILHMGGKPTTLQSGLEAGKTYAFRVAAIGGTGGKSAFSPEVWKAAA